MPFKEKPEGSTHYYGDGCGEPEHNDCPECQFEEGHSRGCSKHEEPLFDGVAMIEPIPEEVKRKYPQEMLLMNGCPNCGQEVNRKFVENLINEIVSQAKAEGYDEGAHEATMVCNEKTIPFAVERERQRIIGMAEGLQAKANKDEGYVLEELIKKI